MDRLSPQGAGQPCPRPTAYASAWRRSHHTDRGAPGGARRHIGVPDPSITEIERRINAIWADAEPLIEKYNDVHESTRGNKAKPAACSAARAAAATGGARAAGGSGAIAAQVYRGGNAGAFAAVVSSGSPKNLADQLTFLDHMAGAAAPDLASPR